MSKNILEEVSKTSIQLLLHEPFYGHFFAGILKDVSERTDSIATSFAGNQMVKLLVNTEYWEKNLRDRLDEKRTKDLRYGAIKHQILHIVFKHMLKVEEFGNKKLFGIAADLAVNQYIQMHQLTEDAITFRDFPEVNFEPNKDVGYYYKILSEILKDANACFGDGEEGSGGSGGEDDADGEGGQEEPSAADRLKELMDGKNCQLDQHQFWEDFSRLTKAEQKIMDSFINDAITNVANRVKNKQHGTLPAGLQIYIDLLMESLKPQVNWRRVLRLFAESSSRTYLKNTIRRPSKRYGTTPGIRVRKKQKILIAVDTSGSVNDEELRLFFSEIYHIWKQGAEIYVVECDTHIHNEYHYKGIPPKVISGRGGTDFNAPIEFANDEYHPDAIIYFTDGYASVPNVKNRKPILWLITSEGINESDDLWSALPDRKVKMY